MHMPIPLPVCVNINMRGRKVCLLAFILCLHRHLCTCQMYLPSIITAIDKSLQYYADNYMHMNFDGIFGLRVLEGSYVPTDALSYSRWRCKTSACCNLSEHSFPLNCLDYLFSCYKLFRTHLKFTSSCIDLREKWLLPPLHSQTTRISIRFDDSNNIYIL